MTIVVYPNDLRIGGRQRNAVELAAAVRDQRLRGTVSNEDFNARSQMKGLAR